jgi:Putative transmembrane protein (PGPGW)
MELMSEVAEFMSGAALAWMTVISLLVFFGSLIVVRLVIIKLPADYFINDHRKKVPWAEQHILLRYILLVVKNLFGYILIVAGLIMLVLPGQGVLSIVFGVMLADFPGKFRFERWLIHRGPVLKVSNKIRREADKVPFIFHRECIDKKDTQRL